MTDTIAIGSFTMHRLLEAFEAVYLGGPYTMTEEEYEAALREQSEARKRYVESLKAASKPRRKGRVAT
jgi:hypothetical protein